MSEETPGLDERIDFLRGQIAAPCTDDQLNRNLIELSELLRQAGRGESLVIHTKAEKIVYAYLWMYAGLLVFDVGRAYFTGEWGRVAVAAVAFVLIAKYFMTVVDNLNQIDTLIKRKG